MREATWGDSQTDVLASLHELLATDDDGILATVVSVEGNAYRRPGAKMVIPAADDSIGHITAGCLEDEVHELASEVLDAGKPRVETYDLRTDRGQDVWGLGIGCNGIVDILLEPIDQHHRDVAEAHAAGEDRGVLTVIETGDSGRVGARAQYDPTDDTLSRGTDFPQELAKRLRDTTVRLTDQGRAGTVEVDGMTVFVDGIAAPEDLVVLGAGNDVRPITDLGAKAGFRVTVVGFRGGIDGADRFPDADEVRTTSPTRLTDTVDFDLDTYVVVATHNFVDDRLVVEELLGTDVPYIGLMGPEARFEEIRQALGADGRSVRPADLDRIYAPVGLDLGGGSPYQIALSVVGEVMTVSNERDPGHLSTRSGPIHDRIDPTAPRDT